MTIKLNNYKYHGWYIKALVIYLILLTLMSAYIKGMSLERIIGSVILVILVVWLLGHLG